MIEPEATVVIRYQSLPGREDRAKEEIRSLIAIVVAEEPDCLSITFLEDRDHPGRLLLYERWTSREAYLGPHLQTPHLRAFKERASDFAAGPPTIEFWSKLAELP